jgi:catechol 2,3-dioxygenase
VRHPGFSLSERGKTMRQSVACIRSVEIEMTDPERAAAFYRDVWHLTETGRQDGVIYLRGTSRSHHILAIHPSHGPGKVRRVVFEAADHAMVDRLHAKVAVTGVPCEAPHRLNRIDGGYGFGFADLAGRALAVVAEADNFPDDARVADRPYKIAHVNLNDTDAEKTRDFFVEALGFRTVDHAGPQFFLNCDSADHSTMVICKSQDMTLNHVSFEMPDLESVMRGAGRMRDHGYPIEWGPGRHGSGNNVFAYFAGPEELPIEYTAEVLQIDDSYVFGGPDKWKWPPGRLDHWGVTPPHTQRWKRIQSLYGFAMDAYRL